MSELVPDLLIRLTCWDGGFAETPEDEREASMPWETDGDFPWLHSPEDDDWRRESPSPDQPGWEDA